MATAKPKTIETNASVEAFVKTIPDQQKQDDCFAIIGIMKEISGFEPKMWGPAIIGFGSYHYKYESGHEGDAPLAAFAPRKDAIALYLASTFKTKEELLARLGKHKAAKACVYIKKLQDIDVSVLKQLISHSIKESKALYD